MLLAAALQAGSAARAVDVQPAHKAAIKAAEIYKVKPTPATGPTVPKLKGKPCDEAEKLLLRLHSLLLSCEVGTPGDQAVGTINRLEPEEGQPLGQVRGVKAWTEPEPEPAPPPVPPAPPPPSLEMPDLAGKSCAEAQAAVAPLTQQLPGLELVCSDARMPSVPTTPGRIYEQEPPASVTLSEARVLTAWVGPAAAPPDDTAASAAGAGSDAAASNAASGDAPASEAQPPDDPPRPPWLVPLLVLLGGLGAGAAGWQWRKRTAKQSTAPTPTPTEVGLRALPDPHPSVSLHWSGAPPDAPAPGERLIGLRARPDAAPGHALRWLDETDDPNGAHHD